MVGLGWSAEMLVLQAHDACGSETLVKWTWNCDNNRNIQFKKNMETNKEKALLIYIWSILTPTYNYASYEGKEKSTLIRWKKGKLLQQIYCNNENIVWRCCKTMHYHVAYHLACLL
jgi:hypothetical protein